MAVTADPMQTHSFVVEHVRRETADTFTLSLNPEQASDGFPFAAGQFTMLSVPGIGEVPISVSGDPEEPLPLIHTIRDVGSVTHAICTLKPGELLGVRGPYGVPWPVEVAKGGDVVILAGGLGLAPLRPALYAVLAQRPHYSKVLLLYGARTPQDLLYTRELEKWGRRKDMQVEVTVDRATSDWHGHVGVITTLIPKAAFDPEHVTVLVCGPEIMMHFTLLELHKRGVRPENIFISMERNMQCGIGLCGHCQLGPYFVCKDGPVFRYDQMQAWLEKREV